MVVASIRKAGIITCVLRGWSSGCIKLPFVQHHRCFVFLAATAFILGCTNSGEWFDSSWPKMGAGEHQWVWQSDWLPGLNGEEIGPTHGCVAIDSLGLVYLNTDAAAAIRVYSPGGKLLRSFGDEWSGGLHGMEIVSQGGEESIFITHLGRHQVAKLSMEGDVHWVLDWPQQSGLYKSAEEYKPTSIAVAEDGRFWVADGYGRGFVHCYSADGEWLSAFGGPGSEDGKFRTPHGISWDANAQSLIVSDRENRRLQVFRPEESCCELFPPSCGVLAMSMLGPKDGWWQSLPVGSACSISRVIYWHVWETNQIQSFAPPFKLRPHHGLQASLLLLIAQLGARKGKSMSPDGTDTGA
jgi:hypothetical protein